MISVLSPGLGLPCSLWPDMVPIPAVSYLQACLPIGGLFSPFACKQTLSNLEIFSIFNLDSDVLYILLPMAALSPP